MILENSDDSGKKLLDKVETFDRKKSHKENR